MRASRAKRGYLRRLLVCLAACLVVGQLACVLTASLISLGRCKGWPRPLARVLGSGLKERPIPVERTAATEDGRRYVEWYRNALWDRVQLSVTLGASWEVLARMPRWYGRDEPSEGAPVAGAPPRWAVAGVRGESREFETVAYGWPVRVLRVRGIAQMVEPYQVSDGIGRYGKERGLSTAWGLAWRPIWPDVLVGGAVYGGVLWVVVSGVMVMRIGWRRWRGRCVGCGYDVRAVGGVGASACPECGEGA